MIETFGDHPDGVVIDGKIFTLWVSSFPAHDRDCRTNFAGEDPAFLSKCRSWKSGRSPLFFYAGLGNNTPEPQSMRLENFVLVGLDGTNVEPRFVGRKLLDVGDAMPRTRRVLPGGETYGYLAFSAPKGFMPARLSYSDAEQKLTVLFPADQRSVTPS